VVAQDLAVPAERLVDVAVVEGAFRFGFQRQLPRHEALM
jgi:hypothetical protein